MRVKLSSISSVLVLLAGFAGYAPGALAENACSCMCTDQGPSWICSTPFGTAEPASCAVMECPVAGSTPVDTSTDTPPATEPAPDVTDSTGDVTDPVAAGTDVVEPPIEGLECTRRNVYRPDMGKYKTYKVCKPAMSEAQKANIAEYRARMQERWDSHQARHQLSRGDNRGDNNGHHRRDYGKGD